MAKPIFIVGLPDIVDSDELTEVQKIISNAFKDYYVLVYKHTGKDYKFDCFYGKDFNEVKFEELKQIVKDRMKKHDVLYIEDIDDVKPKKNKKK